MAITHVALSDTIATWRTRHNEQATLQGDLANLINDSAGSKANLVIELNARVVNVYNAAGTLLNS